MTRLTISSINTVAGGLNPLALPLVAVVIVQHVTV